MGKRPVRTLSWKKTLPVFAALVIFLLPMKSAEANSGPPPSVAWFSLVYETILSPRLAGIQLIACMTQNCEQPVLLQQYGRCEEVGCLTSAPQLTGWMSDFACAENVCRSSAYPTHGGTFFKLVAQFSDRVRSSEAIEKLPSKYGDAYSWRVTVRDSDLSIVQDSLPAVSDSNRSFPSQPLLLFGASILVEVLVAGMCFWRTVEAGYFENSLLIVLLVNLISLPVVWFFFPALGQFQSEANRSLGFIFLAAAFVYGALLAGIYRTGRKIRGWIILLTIISLPVTFLCVVLIPSVLHGYSGGYITVQGLPANLAIAASEVFAVVFEALLITILGNGKLPVKWIWITSLLMNAASFGTGYLLTNTTTAFSPRPTPAPPATPMPPNTPAPMVWTNLGSINGSVLSLAIDPMSLTNLYAGMAGAGVFKSSDGGGNWVQINNGLTDQTVYALVIDPATPTTLYAGTLGGVYKSTDGGANWSAANRGLVKDNLVASVSALVIDPETPTTIYAGTPFGIFKSTDGGGNWSLGTDPTQIWGVDALAIHQTDTTSVYAGAVGGVYVSTDEGMTVTNLGLSNVYALAINPAMPGWLYAGTMGGVFKSIDGGVNWTTASNGLAQSSVLALAIDPVNPDTLYAGMMEGGVFKSTDGGARWEAINEGLTASKICALLISPAMPGALFVGTDGGGVFVMRETK